MRDQKESPETRWLSQLITFFSTRGGSIVDDVTEGRTRRVTIRSQTGGEITLSAYAGPRGPYYGERYGVPPVERDLLVDLATTPGWVIRDFREEVLQRLWEGVKLNGLYAAGQLCFLTVGEGGRRYHGGCFARQ